MSVQPKPVLCTGLLLSCLAVLGSGCSEPSISSPPPFLPPPASTKAPEVREPIRPPYSLAILPFEDYSNRPDLAWLRQGLPDMLITDLALIPGLRLVSRHRLGEVLREQWLQHRGSFQESPSVRLGRLTGARYLVSGIYYVAGSELILEVHLLDVEQGSVARAFRVTGTVDAIPSLELDLARRIGSVFDSGFDLPASAVLPSDLDVQEAPEISLPLPDPAEILEATQAVLGSSIVSSPLMADTLLSLERLRGVREAATRIADRVWTQGVSIRLGPPQYEPQASTTPMSASALTVWVPVEAEVERHRIGHLDRGLQLVDGDLAHDPSWVILVYGEVDPGALRMFVEAMQMPRRLFVRAIRESGEVVAVSSQWSWRVDHLIQLHDDGTVGFPASPQTLLTGRTPFGGSWMVGPESTVRFDAVIVPVPEEARTVSVEVVEGPGESPKSGPGLEFLQSIRAWLLHRWNPPLTESLPVSGYLPGNRRMGVVTLSGSGGTVQKTQVIHVQPEAGFARSIRQLLTSVQGKCFSQCEKNLSPHAPKPKAFQLRVQFELIKDIRHVGLSRKI